MKLLSILAAFAAFAAFAAAARAAPLAAAPLEVEAKIPLGDVRGRIDHLAVDLNRQRLYVAELGNDTVGVIDLPGRRVLQTLTGLKEPQGIGYEPSTDTVIVANARDGSVRLFHGSDLTPVGQIELGDDADNVRIEDSTHQVWVGYADGALAIIDPGARRRIADIPLHAHPESFRLDGAGPQIYVNVPDAHEIAVVDRTARKQIASWKTGNLAANFPLALDDADRILTVFRHPARLAEFRKQDGALLQATETCGDSDDLFVDARRHRVYVICGEGFVEVFGRDAGRYRSMGRLATSSGARTALFVPELDRLFVAARATGAAPAAVWVIRPTER